MRILRWMSDNTLQDRLKNENTQDKVQVLPITDKMRDTHP